MTLVMKVKCGESEQFGSSFVMVTTDTRMVHQLLHRETLEPVSNITMTRDVYDKVVRLTDNVLLCTGGVYSICQAWQSFMIEHSKNHYFLDDMEEIIDASQKYLKEEAKRNRMIKKHMNSQFRMLELLGYYRNGKPGSLKIKHDGNIEKVVVEPETYYATMFPPTEDILENHDILMDFGRTKYGARSALEHILLHLLDVHAIVASQEDDKVSETCLVHLLKRVGGKTEYEFSQYDLTPLIEKYKSLSEVLSKI